MAGKPEILGFWASPFSCRVELALKLKNIEYEFKDEDLLNKKSNLLLKYNPVHKKVPVLLHLGNPIAESLVILEYIEETWNSQYSIFPENPHERALSRFWAKFIDDKFLPALSKAVKSEGEEREKGVEEAREALEKLENEVNGKKYFGGERMGFVDIVAVIVAYWVPAIEEVCEIELLRKEKLPELWRWRDNFISQSLVKEKLPPKDKLIAHLQRVFTMPPKSLNVSK